MSPELTRRDFVIAAMAGLGCFALRGTAAGTDLAAVRSRLFQDRILEVEHILRYTGRYLAKHPGEADADTLLRLIFGSAADGEVAAMKRAARSRIRKDFEEGRVESLDGWILSVSEVRLWCLYVIVTT
jgi:hypothetical protein